MEKRLPLALLLSALVLFAYTKFFVKPVPPTPQSGSVIESNALDGNGGGSELSKPTIDPASIPVIGELLREDTERELVLDIGTPGEAGSYRATFTNRGGSLSKLLLANFVDKAELTDEERLEPQHWIPLVVPSADGSGSLQIRTSPSSMALARPDEGLDEALWVMSAVREDGAAIGVDFRYGPGTGVVFEKRVRFIPGLHAFDFELTIINEAAPGAVGQKQFVFTPGEVVPHITYDRFYQAPQAVAGVMDDGEIDLEVQLPMTRAGGELGDLFPARGGIVFAGVHNKYFAILMREMGALADANAIRPSPSMIGASWRRSIDEDWISHHPGKEDQGNRLLVTDVQLRLQVPAEGESATSRYRMWAGPKKRELMVDAFPGYDAVIEKDLGFFKGISRLLLGVLGFFESIVGNWGVAIILLTISVRLVLFPLNRRSQTAMARYQAKMKRVQPKIDELKKKYENDPQALRQEQAKLMQKEGAFPPLGGCAPMFLQIPVFWGLFQALRVSFDLRQAPFFGWITDLSMPDRLFPTGFDFEAPLMGPLNFVNILPPIMVFLWIWQQRSMPKPSDEQAARMQKMMMWMPIVFGFMLYNYASGLSIYMITQSGLGIFEQRVIKKYWPVDDTEKPKKKTGFMAKLVAAQEAKMKEIEKMQQQKQKSKKKR